MLCVFEDFMDCSDPVETYYRYVRGLDITIAQLNHEVFHFKEGVWKQSGESHSCFRGKSP